MTLFSSIKVENIIGKTFEYIDCCHRNLLMYILLTSAIDEYESVFVRDKRERDSQLNGDHQAAQRGHMYMMIRMKDLFGFINDLEKIIYGIGFKLILKRNSNDGAIFRVNAGAAAVANDFNVESRDIAWCVPFIDPSNDNRIIAQKGLSKRNNIDFSFYERKAFYKNVPDATNFLFNIGILSGFEIPQYIIANFENNVNDQTNDSSIFNEMDVTECF